MHYFPLCKIIHIIFPILHEQFLLNFSVLQCLNGNTLNGIDVANPSKWNTLKGNSFTYFLIINLKAPLKYKVFDTGEEIFSSFSAK